MSTRVLRSTICIPFSDPNCTTPFLHGHANQSEATLNLADIFSLMTSLLNIISMEYEV